MTTATSPSRDPRANPHTETARTETSHLSGWYDPDGSAWEPESDSEFEALRATSPRPTGRADREQVLAGLTRR
jgi:hypothetical protein